jgi:hypothetical protein
MRKLTDAAAGLQIARWKCVMPQNRLYIADVGWRKIFRSLIFMDSWLSYTLGYPSEVSAKDIQVGYRATVNFLLQC